MNRSSLANIHLVSDFIESGDTVILVVPTDDSDPKEGLILPQQIAIRDILGKNGIAIVVQDTELEEMLNRVTPKLVITDSLVFHKVKKIVPDEINLTSFSILMARYKGFLDVAINGINALDKLKSGANILIAEGYTNSRQYEDIGKIKLPKWIREYTQKDFNFEWTSGTEFPEDLSKYDLVIHCSGCILSENEIKHRMESAIKQKIPFTNYGVAIAKVQGMLDRSINFIK